MYRSEQNSYGISMLFFGGAFIIVFYSRLHIRPSESSFCSVICKKKNAFLAGHSAKALTLIPLALIGTRDFMHVFFYL